jgi:hypothetical protein
MYLILSTLPHFYSILPVIPYYRTYTFGYIHCILVSTTFSILYHVYQESNPIITALDYFFAFLWFVYDIYMGYMYTNALHTILGLNTIVFLSNIHIPYDTSYTLYHSVWHLMSASKCILVSYIIERNLRLIIPIRHIIESGA